jgi:UTP--glucose-1-phosphate uridylyltransferase
MPPPVRVAVFPVAGLGTRFLPATKAIPKEMLPVVDKPLVQHVAEEARAAGIERVVFVTASGKSAIEDHFDSSLELEQTLEARGKKDLLEQVREAANLIEVSSVRQHRALGLGHAVLQSKAAVGDQPFAVMLVDDIVAGGEPCIGQMMRVYARRGNPVIALQRVPRADTRQYGIVAADPIEERIVGIRDMVEKPTPEKAPSDLAIIGRYILPPEIFAILEETRADVGGEIQLTSGLRRLLDRGPIDGYLFEGRRYDAGDKLGFLKANVELALERPGFGEQVREYLKGLTRGW